MAPLVVPKKKDGHQHLIIDTREANHHFSPPPYTPLAGSRSLSSLQLPPGTALFKAKKDIQCCFHLLRLPHWLGQFFGLLPFARRQLPRWLQSCVNTSTCDVVEFHFLVVPMAWNWAVWFVQQMLEHLLPNEAGEKTLRHLSPTPHWDDSPVVTLLYIDNFAALGLSQVEADESSTRMLERLEIAGAVVRVEPSTDALLGFELAYSGTC